MKTDPTNYRVKTFTLLIGAAFVLVVSSVQAQRDLITTQAGEQVRCRIIDETPVRFVFAYLKDGKPYRSEIFKNLVTSFKFNHFDADLSNADKLPAAMYRATVGSDTESPRALSNGTISARQKRRNKKAAKRNATQQAAVIENEVAAVKNEATNKGELKKNRDKEQQQTKSLRNDERAAATNKKVDEVNLRSKDIVQPNVIVDEKKSKVSSNTAKIATQEKVFPEGTKMDGVAVTTPLPKEPTVIRKVEVARPAVREVEKTTIAEPVVNTTNRIDRGNNAIVTRQNPAANTAVKEAAKVEKVIEPVTAGKKVAAKNAVSPIDISETELPNITINQENKFRIGLKGGIGNRLDNNAQTTNTFDLYQEQLLRGFTLGADIAYFPTDAIGFGAVFTDFRSLNSAGEILYRNELTGSEQIGSIANNRSVKFVGPALFLRKKLDYKTYVVLGLSPGYNFYTDQGSYDNVDYTFKGGGFGAASTLGIDFLLGNDIIGRDIILSFEAGYNYGRINTLDYGDARGVVDIASPIDLSRLDFTIGLRFLRFPKYFRLTSY